MTVPLKVQCSAALRARILTLGLRPGAELDESQIAAEFGLSRTPLREVYQVLAGEGYLRLEVNRGARVASLDFAVMRSLFQTAPLIYASVARVAAEAGSEAQIEVLREIHSHMSVAIAAGDGPEATLDNHRFYLQIGEMTANPYLQAALGRLLIDHTRLSLNFFTPATKKETKQIKKAAQMHHAMIDALETRAVDEAADLTQRYWEMSRLSIERFAQPDPLPMTPIRGAADQAADAT